MSTLIWTCKKFEELTTAELYCILNLRSKVFVVEQNCVYLDTDGKDAAAYHFCGWLENKLVAYCRLLPPGVAYPQLASIGRVVTDPAHRKDGLGKIMMTKAIAKTYELFDVTSIKIGAQQYLTRFYEKLGFRTISEPYLEDGIPHLEMLISK
jgi:ElaA protein